MQSHSRNIGPSAFGVLTVHSGLRRAFCAALLSFCFIGHASAQSSTSGAIAGTVTDTSGALLPGVSITIKSNETGAVRMAKANSSGEFQVSDLIPGTYTVDITGDGFKTFENKTVVVTVGSISSLTPRLDPGSVTDKVEVTGENPIMHLEDNAISTTIDQNQIENLPVNGRRWSDFARLTPGVVSNLQGFGLLSFRGISYLLNNNTVDGADDNQAYYSEARGRTRTAFSIPPSAVQEFQVNTSNYSAQYGRAAGGVVNTVTRSGSNNLHGELFFYDRDNDLGGATNPYTLLTQQDSTGTYYSVPTKPTDWRKNWGGTVGGPIFRDKLFWIYTYDQERRNFPAISRPYDPNDFFAPSNATLPSGETCSTSAFTTSSLTFAAEGDYDSCLIAALFGVSFQAGSAYYQQGLGILKTFIGTVPRVQDQVINLPKIDYQISDRNHLSLMYNRMRYSSPAGLYSQTSYNEGRSGWGNDNVKEDFGIAHLTTVITSSIVNDALVQYGRDFEFDKQQSPLPNELPLSHNQYGAAADAQIGFYFNSGIYSGSNPNLSRYADPDERRLQVLDGITWSHGKHVSKFGLEYNKVSDFDNNLYNGNGSYSYDWTYNYIADYLNATTGVGGPTAYSSACPDPTKQTGCFYQTYYSFSQEFGSPTALITTREYAGYATDDWRIRPNLTLTLGVRYEYEYVPPSPFVNTGNSLISATDGGLNTALPQTANRPDDRNNVGPRVGFAWNVFGDSKTVLRGGYGMYFGRVINSNIVQTYLESGAPNGQTSFTSLYPGHCGPVFPNIYASLAQLSSAAVAGGCSLTPTAAFFSPHMQNPQVHEADLALEQDLGHNFILGLTYMMSLGRELPTAIDTNFSIGATGFGGFTVASATTSTPSNPYAVSSNSEAATNSNFPYPPATGAYVTFPTGGATPPTLPAGYQSKFFLNGTRPNPAYYQILQVQSSVNSSYNALAAQIQKRYSHGFSLLSSITWSHALDENPYTSTVVPSYTLSDPTNPRADYGNSATDVRIRYVAALSYEPQTHFHGTLMKQALGGWRIAPIVQAQSGLPYSPTISSSSFKTVTLSDGTTGTLAGTGINGAGSGSTRVPWIARDSYHYPRTAVVDLRLGKNFYLPRVDRFGLHTEPRFEIFAEIFNLMNHQNITALTTQAYSLTDVKGNATVQTLTPYAPFGTYTNSNSNYTFSPRQVQISGRLHF